MSVQKLTSLWSFFLPGIYAETHEGRQCGIRFTNPVKDVIQYYTKLKDEYQSLNIKENPEIPDFASYLEYLQIELFDIWTGEIIDPANASDLLSPKYEPLEYSFTDDKEFMCSLLWWQLAPMIALECKTSMDILRAAPHGDLNLHFSDTFTNRVNKMLTQHYGNDTKFDPKCYMLTNHDLSTSIENAIFEIMFGKLLSTDKVETPLSDFIKNSESLVEELKNKIHERYAIKTYEFNDRGYYEIYFKAPIEWYSIRNKLIDLKNRGWRLDINKNNDLDSQITLIDAQGERKDFCNLYELYESINNC